MGDVAYDGGPDGMFAAGPLSGCLERLGVKLLRFKTGTPARVNRRSIDYTGLERSLIHISEPTSPKSVIERRSTAAERE